MQVFFILVYTVWAFGVFQVTNVGSYGVTPLDVVQGFLYIYLLKYLFWDGRELRFAPNMITLCLFLLLPVVLLSGIQPILGGEHFVQFIKTSVHWVFVWLFAILCAGIDDRRDIMTNAIRAFLLLGLPIAIFGVYQVIARAFDWPLAWLDVTNVSVYYSRGGEGDAEAGWSGQLALQFENFFRATSIFSEPSTLAAYMSFCMMYLLVPIMQGRPKFFASRVLNWSMAAAFSAALLMTFSLTGALGMAVLVGALLIFERGSPRFRLLMTVFGLGVLLVLIDFIVFEVLEVSILDLFAKRISGIFGVAPHPYAEGIEGESTASRALSMTTGFEIWMMYPLTGVGIGLFSTADPARIHGIQFSDSTFFSVMGELGALGITVVCALFVASFMAVMYWRRHSHSLSTDTHRMIGIMPYFILILAAYGLTSNSFVMASMWFNFGLIAFTVNAAWRETGRRQIVLRCVDQPWGARLNNYVRQRRLLPSTDK